MEAGIAGIVLSFLMGIVLYPAGVRAYKWIKRGKRDSPDYFDVIVEVSDSLSSVFDREGLYSTVGERLFSALNLSSIYILSRSGDWNYRIVYSLPDQGPSKKSDILSPQYISTLIEILRTKKDMILVKDLSYHADSGESIDKLKAEFNLLRIEAAIPVYDGDEINTIILIGKKRSGEDLSYDEIRLLKIMAMQTSIGLKNVRLYNEKIEAERLASLGMMAATFAHEIRNPLTSLKTFVQLLPEKYDDEEFRRSFSRLITDEVERINSLIDDLTDFSSKESIFKTDEIDLIGLMNETLDYIEKKCQMEGHDIEFRRSYTDSSLKIQGDRKKLRRAFENIILNGCQALNGKGCVEVSIVPNGNYAVVVVSDNGKGIPETQLEKVFSPFYTTKREGMGLGLAITRKIINDHSGSIKIDSRPSKGTTVTVSLPYEGSA